MKTLAITILHPFSARNILQSDALKEMVNKQDLSIALITLKSKEEYFRRLYENNNIKVYGFDANSLALSLISKFFYNVSHLLLDYHYLWYKRMERAGQDHSLKGKAKQALERLFVALFANKRIPRIVFRIAFDIFGRHREVSRILSKIKPDALFSTDIFNDADEFLVAEAKRRKIPTLGMVRSWDNCYSKGVLRSLPDKMLVNNDTIRNEVVLLHDMPESKVILCGLPQYDYFVRFRPSTREAFRASIKADSVKKIILFSPAGSILSDTDWQIGEIILDAIKSKDIKSPAFLMVRNHPHHPGDMTKIQGREGLHIESPGRVLTNRKEAELSEEENQRLADTLYHSDIIIYVATTLGNDSLIFDKPQIVVNFDGYEKKDYIKSVKRYHNEDHMKNMLELGGAKIVRSAEELISAINAYLSDPKLDSKGRKAALEQQVQFTDGKSGYRVGQAVLGFLKDAGV